MKIGDLVSVNALKSYSVTPNCWIVTEIQERGTDHRGTLMLCYIRPLCSKRQSPYWKWTYELEVISENRRLS